MRDLPEGELAGRTGCTFRRHGSGNEAFRGGAYGSGEVLKVPTEAIPAGDGGLILATYQSRAITQ